MANLVLTVLSITIGLFFILSGTLKLNTYISEDIYKDMRKVFIRTAKVFPLINLFGWKLNPQIYRRVVGVTEVIGGILLAIVPGPMKQVANVVLMLIMAVTVYSHYMLGDGLEKTTPSLIFGMLLACRFIVYLQILLRERDGTSSNADGNEQFSEEAVESEHNSRKQRLKAE